MDNNNMYSPLSVTLVNVYDNDLVCKILDLEKRSFPDTWLYDDAFEYYSEAFKKKENTNIFLKRENEIIGYLLAVPLSSVFADLQEKDRDLENKSGFYYLDTIEIVPESRGIGGAKLLIETMCKELNKRGVNQFALHARTANGLNKTIKKLYPHGIMRLREIENWHYGGGEKYEYIEWVSI